MYIPISIPPFLVLLLLLIASPLVYCFNIKDINTLITFGDSYTTQFFDVETLKYACPNCTSAGGPNWVEYLSNGEGWIYWDFAYNSAPINNSLVVQNPSVIDVTTQVNELYARLFVSPNIKMAAAIAEQYKSITRTAKSTLVTVWVGINDIDLTYNWTDTNALDNMIMQQYKALLNNLIDHGNTQFMLFNIPPLERTPMWRENIYRETIKRRVISYNQKLKRMAHALNKRSKTTVMLFDAWSTFNHILDEPLNYGIDDVFTYCPDWGHPKENKCNSIDSYFWLNDLHPTYHVHQLIATAVQQFLAQQSSPSSL